MKRWTAAFGAAAIGVAAMCFMATTVGQGGLALREAAELVKQMVVRGGRSATAEIEKLGGERGVQQVLEKAAKEGGDQLVEKLRRHSLDHGPSILRGAKDSPSKFISAFETLPAQFRTGAVQAIRREPAVMQELIRTHGDVALEAAARHPGVGPAVLSKIGAESAAFLKGQPTDQVIRVARLADGIGKATPAQRNELLSMIQRAPEKVLNLLETNPRILATGAALAAFLAAKDLIFGDSEIMIGPDGKVITGPDGKPLVIRKPGVIEQVTGQVTGMLKTPLTIFATVAGVLLSLGSLLYMWQLLRDRKRRF